MALAAMLAGGLVACAPAESDPPWVKGGTGNSVSTLNRVDGPPPPEVVVERGDTLYGLSRRYGIPPRSIIEANNLQPPYYLQAGQRLVLPRPRTYTVQRGDTLSVIARDQSVEMSTLARLNNLEPPYVIKVGQVLILPDAPAPDVPASAQARKPAGTTATHGAQQAAAQPTGGDGSTPGQATPSASATGQGQSQGQETPPQQPADAPPHAQAATAPAAAGSGTTPAQPPAAAEAPAAAPPAPPPRSGRAFAWPVQGKILSQFGPAGQGLRNDGINIAAAHGTAVKASDHGVVVYAGNELKGFGNLLLVRHADGYMTAYGHCADLTVKRGDTVKRGQPIATVGQSGNVTQPQLHFEIRKGSDPIDPLKLLDRAVAAL